MILLLDIGNTNTHVGLANSRRVVRHAEFPTPRWETPRVAAILRRFAGNKVSGAIFCTVVPAARTRVRKVILQRFQLNAMELTARTVEGVGIDYPNPRTVGTDRLANAVAVRHHFGAPAVVIDFGTAVTFDVVDPRGNYAGGIIAPGLSAMTDYLHEKTALLPRIRIRDIDAGLGKSTEEAMLIGAVHGYRGLIRELLKRLKSDLKVRRLPVVATGGCASLIASKMTEITAVEPLLTLEGLRLVWTRRNLEK
jgi:type III pantothenate kinase